MQVRILPPLPNMKKVWIVQERLVANVSSKWLAKLLHHNEWKKVRAFADLGTALSFEDRLKRLDKHGDYETRTIHRSKL